MSTMALTRPVELKACRVRLTMGPAAAAEARGHVRAAICAWEAPADADVAVLLTSELVTNAIRHTPGLGVMLSIQCTHDQLRVEVDDWSPSPPVLTDAPPDADAGRGLALVASLASDWGFYRIPTGKTVYFTLAFQPDPSTGGRRGAQLRSNGHGERSGRT
jgi:anti-sigma regulatory factor (Ser/Thr protein kinase)